MNNEEKVDELLLDNSLFSKEKIDNTRLIVNIDLISTRRLLLLSEYLKMSPKVLLYRIIRKEWKEWLSHKSFLDFLKKKKNEKEGVQ